MTIIDRVLDLIPNHSLLGLGSGRAALAFVRVLGAAIRVGKLQVRAVPTSEETAAVARQEGVPLLTLAEAGRLDICIDGADEVDPNLDLIKGYGRALVREKIVAASSRYLYILIGQEKLVPQLGSRGKLPVEVVPFALPLCEARLRELGCRPVPYRQNDTFFVTDNGNHIIDCEIGPIAAPAQLESEILDIPGVVDTGLFLGMASRVLVGETDNFWLIEDWQRNRQSSADLSESVRLNFPS
jgi:ribose 5-phosphate isomerase A